MWWYLGNCASWNRCYYRPLIGSDVLPIEKRQFWWPWVTFIYRIPFQMCFRTVVQQLTRFQLTQCVAGSLSSGITERLPVVKSRGFLCLLWLHYTWLLDISCRYVKLKTINLALRKSPVIFIDQIGEKERAREERTDEIQQITEMRSRSSAWLWLCAIVVISFNFCGGWRFIHSIVVCARQAVGVRTAVIVSYR